MYLRYLDELIDMQIFNAADIIYLCISWRTMWSKIVIFSRIFELWELWKEEINICALNLDLTQNLYVFYARDIETCLHFTIRDRFVSILQHATAIV